MGENQRTSLCNKSTLKTSNPDTDCLPCLSVNVKAKTNLKPNSSNGKLGNCDGNNCPLRWWRLKASGERAAGGFRTSRGFYNFASADHHKHIAKYKILSSSQGLEVKAEESHLRPRLQLKSIKRRLGALLDLSIGDTFWLLCLKKSTLIIFISFPIFSKRIVLS